MRIDGPALRLTILSAKMTTGTTSRCTPRSCTAPTTPGWPGPSVLRGIEGYGASSRIHTSRILSLSGDLPLTIIIMDAEDKVRAFLPQLDELVTEGLVTIDPVEVIRYVGRPAGERP